MDLTAAIWKLLGVGVLPLWLLAGAADWFCHRRTSIERTSGPGESVFHAVLYVQIAVPVLLAMLLEINAAMLLVFSVAVLAHMATSWWDTAFSQPKRHIAPIEQQVHSWLEMLPLFALVLVTLLHLPALEQPQWSFMARAQPVPSPWDVALTVLLGAGILPILEEWFRGWRVQRTR